MRRVLHHARFLFSLFLGLCCIVSIAGYAWSQRHHYRHLYTVKPGVLYRSGQLSPKGLERVIYEKNIGTVVNLRGGDAVRNKKQLEWEEQLCFKNFVYYVTIPLGSPEHRNSVSPTESEQIIEQAVEKFLDIMSDPVTYPRPILVHCLAGKHRTGVMAALYRIEHQGWSKEQAIAEMRKLGYRDFISYDPLRDYLLNWIPTRHRKATSITTQHQ